mmetsp:Transcript_25102/g.37177  ORF Transcript_25102/g.37177 Transcript_25102/m.37177 type:complete len:117 (-) Transcript_25102:486-836(-)
MVDLSFDSNQIEPIITKSIDQVLGKESYDETKSKQWINDICEKCIEGMASMEKPYKYAVTCVIMQRNGAGLQSAHSCYWNLDQDHTVQVSWPNDKTQNTRSDGQMICIVTVAAASI